MSTLTHLLAAAKNPLDGVTPDTSGLGGEFNSKVSLFLSIVWGLCLAAAVGVLILSWVRMAAANTSGNAHNQAINHKVVMAAVWAVAGLRLVPVLVGALILVTG